MPGTQDRRKRLVRAGVRAARSEMTASERSAAGTALTERLAALVSQRGARRIACYLPLPTEPDTRGFLRWAGAKGIEVLLPSARPDGLLDWIVDGDEGTVAGAFGIPEPVGEHLSPLAVGEVDLMLIPACAVDLRGVRLGWGRGYFDRSLASMARRPPVFAVVHESELVDELPFEPHDVPVDGAVTPARIVDFAGAGLG
ncbi:5-formyltetrahydrofolate cyclo-ligase [Leucobacter weissii]|uniref:5-formyltetrahydrofolate cyclo-ligase n=1 Tax=Leucobacter weissii TaxID=1983706 RepID=A0A939SAR6_9MICO|nr:5-formyltetrahydrofolate cyclo-ligase [Leucobacter weissii]MBO1900745.1 5-formyltetrahydrofolate cyclo-ligase [Leucobacter weissii]